MNGALKKLKIESYTAIAMAESDKADSFDALFNPESYSRKYEIEYDKNSGTGNSGTEVKFGRIKPQDYSFEFLFDGTGTVVSKRDVHDDIEHFLRITGKMDGDIHRPRFLKISWGTLVVKCVLKSASVSYSLFKPDGSPLRAKIAAVFTESVEDILRIAQEGKNSPDLTHLRTVQEGDNLPLMTYRIYGDASLYQAVAQWNGLDNFRAIESGQSLSFPPLVELQSAFLSQNV